MNRLILFVFAVSVLTSNASAQTFGVTAGGNFQRLEDISLNEIETKFQSQTGWHVGVWIELPLGPVAALRAGGRYMAAGKLFEGLQDNNPRLRENFDVSLIELYLVFRLGLPSRVVSPYVFAGPVFRMPTNTEQELSNDLRALSYAGEIGGGLVIDLGPVNLYPEIAYVFGLTQFVENEIILQFISLQVGDPQKLNMAMLRLSVGL